MNPEENGWYTLTYCGCVVNLPAMPGMATRGTRIPWIQKEKAETLTYWPCVVNLPAMPIMATRGTRLSWIQKEKAETLTYCTFVINLPAMPGMTTRGTSDARKKRPRRWPTAHAWLTYLQCHQWPLGDNNLMNPEGKGWDTDLLPMRGKPTCNANNGHQGDKWFQKEKAETLTYCPCVVNLPAMPGMATRGTRIPWIQKAQMLPMHSASQYSSSHWIWVALLVLFIFWITWEKN